MNLAVRKNCACSTAAPVAGAVEGRVVRVFSVWAAGSVRAWALAALAVSMLGAAVLLAAPAGATNGTTHWVDAAATTAPGSGCGSAAGYTSIQAAIDAADPGDTVEVCEGTYTETLDISKNLTLQGAGAATTIIQAHADPEQATSRVVTITGSTTTVAIAAVTIRHGRATGATVSQGGGIRNSGNLTLTGSTISGNKSDGSGGGIWNSGAVTLTGSEVSGNTASTSGGISNSGGGASLKVEQGSLIADNTASSHVGGINNSLGAVLVTGSKVADNTAGGSGGGIRNSSGSLTVEQASTVSGNSASSGGGIYNTAGTVTVTGSTVSGNTADGVTSSSGGGIHNDSGTVTVNESTVSGNKAEGTATAAGGGGIYNTGSGQLTVKQGAIISDNEASRGGGIFNRDVAVAHLTASNISRNSASFGGGIANAGRGSITLTETTVLDNDATELGGGIYNLATLAELSLIDSSVSDNSASRGGGIHNSSKATLTRSSVSLNIASASGGGIFNIHASGILSIIDSDVSENSAVSGGGLFNLAGRVTFSESEVSRNTASFGGGLHNSGGGEIRLVGSTVSLNAASGSGGGISNTGSASTQLTVEAGSTIVDNSANNGGGIQNFVARADIRNSMIKDNKATNDGGGLYNLAGTAAVEESIILNNSGRRGGGIYNSGSGVVSDSTIKGNKATLDGGGIHHVGTVSTLALTDSDVVSNTADAGGGGINNSGGTVTVTDSGISGNGAFSGGGIRNLSGATVMLKAATVSSNNAVGGAGVLTQGTVIAESGVSLVDRYVQFGSGSATRLAGGDLASTETITIQGGVLEGTGAVDADVLLSSGTISPGLSAGTIAIGGNYEQGPAGGYQVEIGGTTPGTEHDQVDIDGHATFDGTLEISLIGGFAPGLGDSFTIMTFASRTGEFATVNGAEIGNGLWFQVVHGAGSVVLMVVEEHTLTPRKTETAIDCAPDIQQVNAEISCTATVTDSDPAPGATAPEGMVSFTLNGVQVGDCELGNLDGLSRSCPASFSSTVAMVAEVVAHYGGVHPHDRSDSEPVLVVFYEPEGGFVTGAGWFHSPSAAYVEDPSIVGPANFALVSRYQAGAHVPTGNTQFRFQAADLVFQSTSYEWLVISGARAQYRGEGTLNGVAGHRFMITVIDGSVDGGGGVDRIRVRIWHDVDGLIYDNQLDAPDDDEPTTALGGGNINIQSGGQGGGGGGGPNR